MNPELPVQKKAKGKLWWFGKKPTPEPLPPSSDLVIAKSWINILLKMDQYPAGEHAHIRACAFEFANATNEPPRLGKEKHDSTSP